MVIVDFKKRKTAEQKEEKEKEKAWSEDIRSSAGWVCSICGSPNRLHAHHIIPREHERFKFDLENGIALCAKHHKFCRNISAHNNPMAFFLWLQKYHYVKFITAVENTKKLLLVKEGIEV